MKKRTRLLSVICVLGVIVGIWAVTDSVRGIVYPFNPSEETLTERQRQTVQQIKAILDPWQPVGTALLVLNSVKGVLLVVAGVTAFRLHPLGRKLLISALLFAIVADALGLVWFVGTSAATFEINLRHVIGTDEIVMRAPPSPNDTRIILALAFAAFVALDLLKIGLEAAACKYLRSGAIRQLYAISTSGGERAKGQANGKQI